MILCNVNWLLQIEFMFPV
uniref:Uncharacterized protein n=1 Tax=Rhizophora mucronata TaxID=61149 RepID=A0A2P2PWV1_RHIMU